MRSQIKETSLDCGWIGCALGLGLYVIYGLNQRVGVLVISKVLLDNSQSLFVDLMVWMSLKLLEVVKASCLLHLDSESVISISVQEVILTASQDILDTLKSNSEHPYVFAFEHLSEGLNHAFADEDLELLWVG